VLRLIRTADQLIHGDRTDAESVRKRLQLVDGKCEDFTTRLDARRKNLVMARNFFAHAQAVSLTISIFLDWVLSHWAHFTVLRFIFMVALCNRADHYIFVL